MNHTSARPLITTIIPTYRRPKLLRRAIQSVLRQTYPDFQVCVYDNNSGDETGEIVREVAQEDSRVKYHCHQENIGAIKNFNFGMMHIETPFFSILSDDDLLLPEFYETAMEGFEKFSNAIFSGSTTITMTDTGTVRSSSMWEKEGYYEPPDGLFRMMTTNLTWTSVLFRKEVVRKVGKLDEEVGGPSDYDFLLRIAARFPFVISRKPNAILVGHTGSSCANVDSGFLWPGWLKMIRNLTEDERIPIEVRSRAEKTLEIQLRRLIYSNGKTSIRRKNFSDALKVARILKERYHQHGKASWMFFLVWCCDHLPMVHPFLVWSDRIRISLKPIRKKGGKLQKQFGKYKRFLNTG